MSKVVDVVGDVVEGVLDITGVGALFSGLMPDQTQPEQDVATLAKGLQKGIDQPRRITFGRDRVGGVIAHQATVTRGEKEFIQLIVLINGAPIDALEDVFIANKSLTEYPTGSYDYAVADGRHSRALQLAVQRMEGWTDNHIGYDQAHIYIELENNREVFPDGINDCEFLIRGARVWDPRDTNQDPDDRNTWTWSQNAVLCTLHYVRFYGANQVPVSQLPMNWWIAAANVCDEEAEYTDSQGVTHKEPRYTVNGTFAFTSRPLEVLQQLERSFAGKVFRQMGQWYVRVGAWYGAPTYTVTMADVLGDVKIKWHADLRERANTVRAQFVDPKQNYERTDAPPVIAESYLEQDAQPLEQTLSLPFVRSSATAQRLAAIQLEQTRLGGIELPLRHTGLRAAVGRTIKVNIPEYHITNKIYRVIDRRFRLDRGVTIRCIEDGPGIWADGMVPGVEDLTPNTDYVPGLPLAINGLDVTLDADGNGLISWSHPAQDAVYAYDVEVYDGESQAYKAAVTYPELTLPTFSVGHYTVRVFARNIYGKRSKAVATQFSVLTPVTPQVNITRGYNQLTLTASLPAVGVGTQYEWIFLGTEQQPEQSDAVFAQTYHRIGLTPETEYLFKVRTVNAIGNSDWLHVNAKTTKANLNEYIDGLPLSKLSDDAQSLIADINTQVERLRQDTENNLPSLVTKNIDAITGLNEKVAVIDAQNPNNLQKRLEESSSKIHNLERVTAVLDPTDAKSLPALIKINQTDIEKQRLEQQNLGLSVLSVTSAYTNWRREYERRALTNERLIDAAVYIDPDTGTIVNRAYAYTDESFNSAQLLIAGAESKISLNAKQIAMSQNRISKAEAELKLQAGQITQRATFAQVEGQIASALAALQPAYSWQFNTGTEGYTGGSHNTAYFITATDPIVSPTLDYDANENPMFRLRVRKHPGSQWKGAINFNSELTTLHLPEPTTDEWETLSLDATGSNGFTGIITRLVFDLGPCDIDFIEVGKRGANDLALADITSRTTSLENDINARTGMMAQYATTAWVDSRGYQTQSNVQTLIDSFNAKYSISAILQEFSDNETVLKANAAQQWIDAANATIRDQVTSILNSDNGLNERIANAEQNLDAIKGEISQSVSQISGLGLDVKKQSLADIIQAYNQLQQNNELAEQGYSLAAAKEKLIAVSNDVNSISSQQLELVSAFAQNQAYLTSLNQVFANERSARSTAERTLRAEITREGERSVAQANERLAAIVGYCVDAQGNRVDEIDAIACINAGHQWVDGPLIELINEYTAVFVTEKGYQTAANVEQFISTLDSQYGVTATIQKINDDGVIEAAKEAKQWVDAANGTIENVITQFVNKPNGINDNIAFAYDLIQANADNISTSAQKQSQLSTRLGEAEADIDTLDEALITERQARASMGSQLRVEFQTQDLAMLATANEFTRAVTGYCVDAQGNRVDEDDAVACEAAGHTWVDGPAVQRAVEISAAWVTLQGFQTQSNVQQSLNTFDATYNVSATLQQFSDNDTLQKANNAQQFINGAESYIAQRITAYNAQEDGVDAKFSDVQERLDAAEGSISTSIMQIQGLNQAQQATDLNAVIAAYNALIRDNELAELDVKAAYANEKLQAQTTEFESLAKQQLELAALFSDSQAIITSLNQSMASQYQSSVRDQRYQATFENNSARFSDVTKAVAKIDEANTIRDQEFESFVADTVAQFDEVAETFASQEQAYTELQQTLTAKINEDTEAARSSAVSTAQQYTRTAVGYCVNAQGQITSESDAVQCVTDGGTWIAGPLAEYIENLQISDGESSASIKQLRQVFTRENGQLVARGGWTLDNNGRVVSIAGYNDGQTGNIDIGADLLRFGVVVDGQFIPTSYIDNTDPIQPVHVFRGRLELGDGHRVSTLDDIKAQDGADGKDGYTPVKGVDYFDGQDGRDGIDGQDGYTPIKGVDYFDGRDGVDGSNGQDGQRGAGRYAIGTSSGIFYHTVANSAVPGGTPVLNDIVTIYKLSDPAYQQTRRYNARLGSVCATCAR